MLVEKKEPFRQKYIDEGKQKPDIITLRLNKEERKLLNNCKSCLEQTKDSTAIKTLTYIGANVLHDQKTGLILRTVFKNKRNNKRNNILDFE